MLIGQGLGGFIGSAVVPIPDVVLEAPPFLLYDYGSGVCKGYLQVHSSVAPDSVQWARVSSTWGSQAVFSSPNATATAVDLQYSETYVLSVTLTFGSNQVVRTFSIDALTPCDAFEFNRPAANTAEFLAVLTSGLPADGEMVILFGDGQSHSFGQQTYVEGYTHVYPAAGQYAAYLQIVTPRYTAAVAILEVNVL